VSEKCRTQSIFFKIISAVINYFAYFSVSVFVVTNKMT